jgi:drug/metabolite transporter (DMT)-like permease
VISGLLSLPFADHAGTGSLNLFLIFLLGVVQLGCGSILYLYGARHLLAAETTLIALLESVLAPLWVWLLLGETPTAYGLAGGAIVFAAVAAITVVSSRRRAAPAPHPAE